MHIESAWEDRDGILYICDIAQLFQYTRVNVCVCVWLTQAKLFASLAADWLCVYTKCIANFCSKHALKPENAGLKLNVRMWDENRMSLRTDSFAYIFWVIVFEAELKEKMWTNTGHFFGT